MVRWGEVIRKMVRGRLERGKVFNGNLRMILGEEERDLKER